MFWKIIAAEKIRRLKADFLTCYGGGEALLITASDGDTEAEIGSSGRQITLRALYRSDRHHKRQVPLTNLTWLSSCRPLKPVPFREIWLVGKSEFKWLTGYGVKPEEPRE